MSPDALAHRAVLLEEAVAALAVRADGVYVDATFGRGGHSRAILARLGTAGRLIALDRDPEAVRAARAITDARFSIAHAPFSALSSVLDAAQAPLVDGVLADLGTSSPQLDDPERGFSFSADGPLDMRMDPTRGESAAQWLAHATEAQIREAIEEYGEERFAKQVAAAIVAARARAPLVRTQQLAELVAAAVRTREAGQNPATRTFQALRILVNRELEEVSLMLPQAVARSPGRAARRRELPLARRPHRQAFPALARASRRAPGIAAARQRNATTACQNRRTSPEACRTRGRNQSARPQRRAAGRRTNSRTAGSSTAFPNRARRVAKLNLLLLLVLLVCALGLVTSQQRARKQFTQLEHEQGRARELEVEHGQLQLEASTWGLHARVGRIASTTLGLRAPDPRRVRVIDLRAAEAKP
jgi:16S rRNA (cytosine1402-N4)-methyltransferase